MDNNFVTEHRTVTGKRSGGPLAIFVAVGIVVSVTIAFRLPSCGESFWLDELHSAWAVSGTFHEVSPRAAIGNQTTGYFHLLWSWQTMVGNREIEMRLSSVVASCLAAALLVVGVTQRTGSVCAGMVAGAVLAVDPNGVFFGCELRPYAFVILYSVLATWSMMTWIGGSKPSGDKASRLTRNSYGGARWRLAMLFWICVAALVHPTSLGVLALLIPVAFAVAWKTGKLILWRADAFAAIIAVTTLGALAMSSLPESWERRDLWKAFGQATSWWQLWYAWSWVPILGIPIATAAVLWLAVWLIERLVSKRPPHSSTCDSPGGSGWIGMIPGLIGLAGTFVFFCASYFEWVPLWHRRYFVAALPMLAWTTGEMAGCCADALIRIFGGTGKPGFGVTWRIIVSRIGGAVVGVLFIAVMLWYQGTMHTLASGKMPLQLRGERWREAVAVISDQMQNGDVVWLDSQLIEASFLRHPVSQSESIGDAQWEYLRFPLAGPYRLEPVVVVACAEHDSWIRQHLAGLPAGRARVWLIARCGKPAAERFVQRISRYRNVTAAERYGGLPFVLRLDFTQ